MSTAADDLMLALRRAVDEQRAPDPTTCRTLTVTEDPALLRRAGRLLCGLDAPNATRPRVRVAVLATCTVGAYQYLLRASLIGVGVLPIVDCADYGTFELALATERYGRETEPDLVVLLLDETYFLPREWAADVDAVADHVRARLAELRGALATSLARSTATVFLHTVPLPQEVPDTVLGWRSRARLTQVWHELNAALLGLAEQHPRVLVADLVGLLADAPVKARDDRMYRYGDMPYSDGALLVLAQQVRRVVQASAGLSRKVLTLDLDGTLWGGVLGEVGAAGVQLGGLYPGNCYLALQRTVRRLREQGVILVLASKNDAALVDEALASHPEMLLRGPAFSVRAVNWSGKAENLRKAAAMLNLPTRSFVFMDDSDFERGEVGMQLPEVAVVSAAGDPAYLVRSLLRHGWFDAMSLTDTDRRRPELYRVRAVRGEFATGFATPQEYLRALDIQLEIAPATEFAVPRVAQLAARTNQFNLTGVRFDEATTADLSTSAQHLVAAFSMTDRFGPEGIVGALWVARGEREWRVLNLVMSCRVLGRGIEVAAVGWLADRAAAAGARVLVGTFVPSPANGVAADFWKRAGFTATGQGQFALDLAGGSVNRPKWITIRERSGVADG